MLERPLNAFFFLFIEIFCMFKQSSEQRLKAISWQKKILRNLRRKYSFITNELWNIPSNTKYLKLY